MPTDTDNDRFIYRIGAEGEREVVAGTALVVEFGDGRELVIEFSDHPASRGGVTVRSEYFAPGVPRVPFGEQRALPDERAGLEIRPGGGNIMHVSIELFARSDGATVVAAGAVTESMQLLVVDGETRIGVGRRSAVMDFGDGSDLSVSLGPEKGGPGRRLSSASWVALLAGPAMTREVYESVRHGGAFASSSLHLTFGAANLVHVLVRRREAQLAGPVATCGEPRNGEGA